MERRVVMIVDFRPHARLRGRAPVDLDKAVTPVVAALSAEEADLGRIRVVCDWVQYRENFRDVVDFRPIMADSPGTDENLEIAVDVRRSQDVALRELTIRQLHDDVVGRVFLEDWVPGRDSRIWDFNALYWSALECWEKSTGRGYEQALPGGESDARNRETVRELISELFGMWQPLAVSGALPEELYVIELGVGDGNQAKVFLDEFRDLDRTGGHDYYRRLHYLMCDYSQHVLDLAQETVVEHSEHVSSFAVDATKVRATLGFLRHKVFLVYISNVYDNLPTDEVAQLAGRSYLVEVRAYLPADSAAFIAESVSADPHELPALVHKLLRLGPVLLTEAASSHFTDIDAAVEFWRQIWSSLRLQERYVPLGGLDNYQLAPSINGEIVRSLLESGSDIRMQVNNGAVASFVDCLALLHPLGKLVCHDLFVTELPDYRTSFRGPGKYDGSVVNWVNGQLLAQVGQREGFEVRYAPFSHRNSGNIVTMTAVARD